MKAQNLIHIAPGFGWFLGQFQDNQAHRHFALQLSIVVDAPIQVYLPLEQEAVRTTNTLLIKPNVPHALSCTGYHLLLLFNPTSPQGHFWYRLAQASGQELSHPVVTALRKLAHQCLSGHLKPDDFARQMEGVLSPYDCTCQDYTHEGDGRIEQALVYLHAHAERVVPLAEIAAHCALSESRFLHLFKAQTGQTYRRAQLWIRLLQALPKLSQQALTATAHEFGFSDSAHFSRTFKESFGFAPQDLLKHSQFIQV